MGGIVCDRSRRYISCSLRLHHLVRAGDEVMRWTCAWDVRGHRRARICELAEEVHIDEPE